MRAVVTGADGFAGRWLCRTLVAHNARVFAWVRNPPGEPIDGVEYRCVDVRNRRECMDGMLGDQPYHVFHLAAMTHLADCEDSPVAAHNTNVLGTRNVFSSMPKFAVGVLASTCHVYGVPGSLPITEGHPTNPKGAYARSKLEAEAEARNAGRPVVIARAFHHTGPGQSERYAIADWCQQIRGGATVLSVGNIEVRRDYTDVRDVVAGYLLLAEHGAPGETYNLCSGDAQPMSTFIRWAAQGRSVETHADESRIRSSDVAEVRGDPGKAEALGWSRVHNLRETIAEMAR